MSLQRQLSGQRKNKFPASRFKAFTIFGKCEAMTAIRIEKKRKKAYDIQVDVMDAMSVCTAGAAVKRRSM